MTKKYPYISRRSFLERALLSAGVVALGLTATTNAQNKTNQTSDLEKYVNAIIQIESGNIPTAERYEQHLRDYSYGLGQILTKTAKDLEKQYSSLPRLGETPEEIKQSLLSPEINRQYTETLFKKELDFYQDPCLAVAAYNSGHLTPRNARAQQQLNDLYGFDLVTDGRLGPQSQKALKRFQEDHYLEADGILGPKTYTAIQNAWMAKFPNKPNPRGIIPQNRITPHHVKKFEKALESQSQ